MSPQRGVRVDQLDTEHRFGLIGGEANLKSGRYFKGITHATAQGTWTNANLSRLWATPLLVPRRMTIDRLLVNIVAAQASGLVRLGIYRSNADSDPGDLVVDGGTVDASTTGDKTVTVDEYLSPGWYWGAWEMNDGGITMRGRAVGSGFSLGWTNGGNQPLMNLYVTHTFGALPDPFGTVTSYVANVSGHVIYVRVNA